MRRSNGMGLRCGVSLALALLLMAGTVTARQVTAQRQNPAPLQPVLSAQQDDSQIDEIVVLGPKLWKLRRDVIEAEDRFYALYNQLNQNRDYAVSCRSEARLATLLKSRICKVAYMEQAEAEFSQAWVRGEEAPRPEMVEVQRFADYRKHALALINSDQRLLKLVREHALLEQKYNQKRREQFQGRLVRYEK